MENTIYGMENVVANEVVKEETVMEEVKVDNHEGKIKKFCTECGSIMWLEKGSRQTICDECKAKKAQMAKEKMAEKKARYNLTTMNVTMHESTKEELKRRAKLEGLSVADFLKKLLDETKVEEVKQDIA